MLPFSPARFGNPAALGFTPYAGLLDSYTSGMVGWWDVSRALVAGHTGKLIRVRADRTGQPEQDIEIKAATGLMDTAALLSFAGSDSCYVKDITSSYGTLTQATAAKQMRIVNAGSLVTDSSGRACMEAPSTGKFYYNLAITADASFSQFICAQPVSTTGSAIFGGAFRTGDSDLWGIGMTGTDFIYENSIYGSIGTLAGAASGARLCVAHCFTSSGTTTWKIREGLHTGTLSFGGSLTGSTVQLGSMLTTKNLRSGDKVSAIVHFDSALATGTMDTINTLLVA